jgi:rod shape determining protein RodA
MQIVWIGTSITLGFVILMLDDRFYDTFSYIIYGLLLVLLFATIFNPHSIKGSRSWLVLGPLRLQPAEFAKFATALALAKLMSTYGYNIHNWKHFMATLAIIIVPMVFIVLQRETGSALVYTAFFLMFYREGMPGSILFTGVAAVIYFVVGIRFEDTMLFGTPTSVGRFTVLLLIQLFTASMVQVYCKNKNLFLQMVLYSIGITLAAVLVSVYVVPFDVVWVQLVLMVLMIGYLLWMALGTRLRNYYFIVLFAIGSMAFFYSADYVLNHVMEAHQRTRINVL